MRLIWLVDLEEVAPGNAILYTGTEEGPKTCNHVTTTYIKMMHICA